MANTIIASFVDASQAEKAVGALLDNHVQAQDISVMTGREDTHFHTEYAKGAEYANDNTAVTTRAVEGNTVDNDIEHAAKGGISTTTAADAGAGAVKGLGWGAGLGIIAAVASLAIPGFGIVIGGGALATALGAAAATAGAGAAAGAVTGYLKDQGVEEHVAANYEQNLKNGGALVTVSNTSDKVGEMTIREILEKYGALISSPGSAYVS